MPTVKHSLPETPDYVVISYLEYHRAFANWCKYHGKELNYMLELEFRKLIGMSNRGLLSAGPFSLKPEIAQKIGLLAGPNYHAVLKAHEVAQDG